MFMNIYINEYMSMYNKIKLIGAVFILATQLEEDNTAITWSLILMFNYLIPDMQNVSLLLSGRLHWWQRCRSQ